MSMQEHLLSLRGKHASLDGELLDELSRPHPDQTLCARLKREKLRLKDEILRLEETAVRYRPATSTH